MNVNKSDSEINLTLFIAINTLYKELQTSTKPGSIHLIMNMINHYTGSKFTHEQTDDAHAFLLALINTLKLQTKSKFIDEFFLHVRRKKMICDSCSNMKFIFQSSYSIELILLGNDDEIPNDNEGFLGPMGLSDNAGAQNLRLWYTSVGDEND